MTIPIKSIFVKDPITARDDMIRTYKNALINRGVPAPQVGPGTEPFVLFTAIANELAVANANVQIAADNQMPDTSTGANLDRILSMYGQPRRGAAGSVGRATFIAVRHQVAVPRDDIERAVIDRRRPQPSPIFLDNLGRLVAILIPCHRCLEVARISQTVGPDRPQFGQTEQASIILCNIARNGSVEEPNLEPDSPWNQCDGTGFNFELARLRAYLDRTRLGDDQQLPVGAEHDPSLHAPVGRVEMHPAPLQPLGRTIAKHRPQPVDKVHASRRLRPRPAQSVGRKRRVSVRFIERAGMRHISRMTCARPQPVQPAPPVLVARRRRRSRWHRTDCRRLALAPQTCGVDQFELLPVALKRH